MKKMKIISLFILFIILLNNFIPFVYAVENTANTVAVGSGVITGTSQGILNPQGTATRAETASMLYKYCMNVK